MPTTTSILEDKGDIALDWSPFGLESIASGCGISGHYYGVAQMIDEGVAIPTYEHEGRSCPGG